MYSLFRWVFRKSIEAEKKTTFADGFIQATKQRRESYDSAKLAQLEMLRGCPIISVGNEWDNPVVGFATRIDYVGDSPILVGKDYITDDEYVLFSKTYGYTQQRFDALMKLDPFERACLIYNVESTNEFDKYKLRFSNTKEELVEKLIQHGFYEKLAQYQGQQIGEEA